MMRYILIGLCLFILNSIIYALDDVKVAQEVVTEMKVNNNDTEQTQIIVKEGEDFGPKKLEIQTYSYTGAMYDDPLLASGLASGSTLINKSIDSIIESIFYNLLDNKIKVIKADQSGFFVETARHTYELPSGGYVLIDQFSLGPEYSKSLKIINGIPILLGVDGKVGVFDIYIRNDAMRVAENKKLPFFERFVNNWLGVLPVLSRTLPPSFNEHEMYNPVNVVRPPFVFPLTVKSFKQMKLGSIASYNISGGIRVPVLLHERLSTPIKNTLNSFVDFKAIFPYSVFIKGEYRINVLRKTTNIAWVGVTRINRHGHSLNTSIGRILSIFTKVFKGWGGVNILFFPVNMQYENSKVYEFHNLYEFDLSNPKSHQAYEDAVRGDFNLAYTQYLEYLQNQITSGVYFYFNLNDSSNVLNFNKKSYLLVMNNEIASNSKHSEIKIEDKDGNLYVLKVQKNLNNKFVDILTGKEFINFSFSSSIHVIKTDENSLDQQYALHTDHPNPVEITASLEFKDNYVDAAEYKVYISKLRDFLLLPLATVPHIAYREQHLVTRYKAENVFANPTQLINKLHVVYTYLGKLGGSASIRLNYNLIKKICRSSIDHIWEAFAKAYDLDETYWASTQNRNLFINTLKKWIYYIYYPFKIVNLKILNIDFVHEVSSAVKALKLLNRALTKNDVSLLVDSIYQLFDTEYPIALTKALVLLAGLDEVPRSVSFYTSPKGKASSIIKERFRSLNNKVFKSTAADMINIEDRYYFIMDKLSKFMPSAVEDYFFKPIIRKVVVESRFAPFDNFDYYRDIQPAQIVPDIFFTIWAEGMSMIEDCYLYVKINTASSKINLVNTVIGEEVIRLTPQVLSVDELAEFKNNNILKYQFWLSGYKSMLNIPELKDISDFTGMIKVYIAVSKNASIWSDQKEVIFYLKNGKLNQK